MSLSPTEEAINRGEPIRLYRSEFLASPAEHLIAADDRDTIIELLRYHKVTHAIIPIPEDRETRLFYQYERNKTELFQMAREEASCPCQMPNPTMAHSDTVIGHLITIQPYYLRAYMKDTGVTTPACQQGAGACDNCSAVSPTTSPTPTCTHPTSVVCEKCAASLPTSTMPNTGG